MNGGSLQSQYVTYCESSYREHLHTYILILFHIPDANYLLKSLQGFQNNGIPLYAISIQNEPENSNPTYPTCSMSVAVEAQIGAALRTLMNNNGFSSVKLIGFEHNWGDAGTYPIQLMQAAGNSFAGVSFHCYSVFLPVICSICWTESLHALRVMSLTKIHSTMHTPIKRSVSLCGILILCAEISRQIYFTGE